MLLTEPCCTEKRVGAWPIFIVAVVVVGIGAEALAVDVVLADGPMGTVELAAGGAQVVPVPCIAPGLELKALADEDVGTDEGMEFVATVALDWTKLLGFQLLPCMLPVWIFLRTNKFSLCDRHYL